MKTLPIKSNDAIRALMPVDRPLHGGNLVWAAELANCSPHAILDFSASINPLGPPASAIAAIQTTLGGLTAYPDPNYTHLRDAISEYHGISPDYILPGNGAAELLTWACRDLAALDTVVLPTPAFSDYTRALRAFDAAIATVCLADFQTANLARLQPQSSSTAGLLLNNPHNPTGQLFARNAILPLLEQFALVVVDEAFMDFLMPEAQQSVLNWVEQYPHLVVVRSLTKFYSLPGLRLGYAIAHPERLKRWQQWRDPWSVNTLAAAVGQVVLQDHEFQQQTWNWLQETRPALFQALAALPNLHPLPGAANFLLVQTSASVPPLQTELLQRHQILIRDCLSFAELGDRYFRIAIRTAAENQRLLQGLADLQS
ncbi:MAG: threonine-phosphate decarboxylase CobD [Leptolyngbyaceae cyanobacterium bins.349]|nr:threonine-phosphate decarboxylase CobD [Leptolyngbyaceae cyanobacterium bins.349]